MAEASGQTGGTPAGQDVCLRAGHLARQPAAHEVGDVVDHRQSEASAFSWKPARRCVGVDREPSRLAFASASACMAAKVSVDKHELLQRSGLDDGIQRLSREPEIGAEGSSKAKDWSALKRGGMGRRPRPGAMRDEAQCGPCPPGERSTAFLGGKRGKAPARPRATPSR